MPVVSAQTLFQFTSQLETLVKILESGGFWPKYCLEYGWKRTFAVPECCFCDTPLSAIHHHMKNYGYYGIGMTKQWGINKGLSPVMYHLKDSAMAKNIRKTFYTARATNDKEAIYRQIVLMKMYQAVNYIKKINKKGELKLKQHKKYLYYDEREWRYVPNLPNYKDLIRFVKNQLELDTLKGNERIDDLTKPFLCTFTPSDIKYLIVKNDKDRLSLISSINEMKKWENKEKELLESKIITNDLIINDL